MNVAFVTPSFDGADRCRFLLETWAENDPRSFGLYPHVLCADYAKNRPLEQLYGPLAEQYGHVSVVYRGTTGCCHGASKTAIEYALEHYDPTWVVLLSDDLAVPKDAVSSLLYFLQQNAIEQVGAIQPPYWHCCPEEGLKAQLRPDESRYYPAIMREEFYTSKDWTRDVCRNPFWDEPQGYEHATKGKAFPYYSVGGWAMVVRACTYREVGGIPEGSWRYDETLSYRIWTRSLRSIVALPGPPFVHYMGGGFAQGPEINWQMGDEEHFRNATGVTLAESARQVAGIMAKRAPIVAEEMATCRYWDNREEPHP